MHVRSRAAASVRSQHHLCLVCRDQERKEDKKIEETDGGGGGRGIAAVVGMATLREAGLKVAAPDFEPRLIKTLVQYLRRREGGRGKWAKAHL